MVTSVLLATSIFFLCRFRLKSPINNTRIVFLLWLHLQSFAFPLIIVTTNIISYPRIEPLHHLYECVRITSWFQTAVNCGHMRVDYIPYIIALYVRIPVAYRTQFTSFWLSSSLRSAIQIGRNIIDYLGLTSQSMVFSGAHAIAIPSHKNYTPWYTILIILRTLLLNQLNPNVDHLNMKFFGCPKRMQLNAAGDGGTSLLIWYR